MRYFLIFLACVPILLRGEWNDLFSNDEDPSLVHHVNVINGNLNLSFMDGRTLGAKPISLLRTYTSSGSVQGCANNNDMTLNEIHGGWTVLGGWDFLPHTNLFITRVYTDLKSSKAYLAEPSGNVIPYSFSHQEAKYKIHLKPTRSMNQTTGFLSAKHNPKNNLLTIDFQAGYAVLKLPNGGVRTYRGRKLDNKHVLDGSGLQAYYRLDTEQLPNQDVIQYFYSDKWAKLDRIEVKSPTGKRYSWAQFDYFGDRYNFRFKVIASDRQEFHYGTFKHENRLMFNCLDGTSIPNQKIDYIPGRKTTGARIHKIHVDNKYQFSVNYYSPYNREEERKWAKNPEKKEFNADKVEEICAPVGPNGQNRRLAHFTYHPGCTEVRDVDDQITRYKHDLDQLHHIEYYNKKGEITSYQQLYWNESGLQCKAQLDAAGRPVFAKMFQYDSLGNVTCETILGALTGEPSSPLLFDAQGNPSGGESYSKTYQYEGRFNSLVKETEEDLIYLYRYLDNTDLPSAKLTCNKEQIVIREFFFYDPDHLLIRKIIDDGSTEDPSDLTSVTERRITDYQPHPDYGYPQLVTEKYWDSTSHTERMLQKIELFYQEGRVHLEKVYDANEQYRYSIVAEYDPRGRLIQKTTPLGHINSWIYDAVGNLLEIKEVGSPRKRLTYDGVNRETSCIEIETGKGVETTYDCKGKILTQTDSKGNTTVHTYDDFGNRISSQFPKTLDQNGNSYEPYIEFGHDIQGNLTSTILPQQEKIETFYNVLRKPIRVIQADGSEIRHFYNRNGTLAKTIHPDGTETRIEYDLLQRPLLQTIHNQNGDELSRESWTYNSFHLLSHTDTRGLTTHFTYDGAGRKTSQSADGRTTTFEYDALGFLERTDNGSIVHVEKHNVEGLVIEQWDQDESGHIENRMHFVYNEENQKTQAIRITSQGEAVDLFEYTDYRLTRHTDPQNAVTQFIHEEQLNSLNQKVKWKTTIDPLGNSTLEIHDVGDRLVLRQKKNPENQIVSQEEIFYDKSGNKVELVSTLYQGAEAVKKSSIRWQYDIMGRVTEEIESDKITRFSYDLKGHLRTKTLPNQIQWHYTYDELDRIQQVKTSDRKIHLSYHYELGPEPTRIDDLINHYTIIRRYNHFGELIYEKNPVGLEYTWDHDHLGRCTQFVLPDRSSIQRTYGGSHMCAVKRLSQSGEIQYQHQYIQFDPTGRVVEEELVNHCGILFTTHDVFERPQTQTSPWHRQTITYGPSGLVTKTDSTLFGTKNFSYDSLNQLNQEGFQFDSFGNSLQYKVNELNQVVATPDSIFTYDQNGNTKEQINNSHIIQYDYDSLGRLIEILHPNERKILYSYDPLSRLLFKETYLYQDTKWERESKIFYLYDQASEIGTVDNLLNIQNLKVLGLGIKGDIGAAVALEIKNQVYTPLHDFAGNIIALIFENELRDLCDLDPFGREQNPPTDPLNPWRFCSKRTEEHLVFFGVRFYDPSLGRWLTPDPSGYADSINLYVYVLNSPNNRLDLFGLYSRESFPDPKIKMEIPTNWVPALSGIHHLMIPGPQVHCMITLAKVHTNFFISCGHWDQLTFSPTEMQAGKFDLLDHLHELVPKTGSKIGISSYENGILTNSKAFENTCTEISNQIGGSLFIGLHNPTMGYKEDVNRCSMEQHNIETPITKVTRQFLAVVSQKLYDINQNALWYYIVHSEGGVILKGAIERLESGQKKVLQQNLLAFSLGPAACIPKSWAKESFIIYSDQDLITKPYAKECIGDPDYNIKIVPCISSWQEKVLYMFDHYIMAPTYKSELKLDIEKKREKIGFFEATR